MHNAQRKLYFLQKASASKEISSQMRSYIAVKRIKFSANLLFKEVSKQRKKDTHSRRKKRLPISQTISSGRSQCIKYVVAL